LLLQHFASEQNEITEAICSINPKIFKSNKNNNPNVSERYTRIYKKKYCKFTGQLDIKFNVPHFRAFRFFKTHNGKIENYSISLTIMHLYLFSDIQKELKKFLY
jgi:hypothetical protein